MRKSRYRKKRKHRHYARSDKSESTNLTRIGEKAKECPELVFTSVFHHITDIDNLRTCYMALDSNKAVGVDQISRMEYGANLEENLRGLSARLRRMGYRPRPKRRAYIPKPGSEKGRPLGISSFFRSSTTCSLSAIVALRIRILLSFSVANIRHRVSIRLLLLIIRRRRFHFLQQPHFDEEKGRKRQK